MSAMYVVLVIGAGLAANLLFDGMWAVIGAAFLASRPGGALLLLSYFVCLGATAWSYRRVGHGTEPARVDTAPRASGQSGA